jgi:hypothetical protein
MTEGTASPNRSIPWDDLDARARAGVPEHRRGWFQSMIRQGREAEEQGRETLAARCRDRIESELSSLAASSPGTSTLSSTPSTSSESVDRDASATAVTAFAALAARRGEALRGRVRELLDRHAEKLPPAEREELKAALAATENPSEGVSEAQVAGMRRRLVERLLRVSRYRRRAGLFSGWKSGASQTSGAADAPPEGPYNDYRALEETLRRVAATNPEWVAEFLDVYGEMRETERKYEAARGKKNS